MKEEPEILYRRLLAELPQIIKVISITSRMHKAKYDALLAEGFTEQQSLELCKTIP